jgi:hypothetical protein
MQSQRRAWTALHDPHYDGTIPAHPQAAITPPHSPSGWRYDISDSSPLHWMSRSQSHQESISTAHHHHNLTIASGDRGAALRTLQLWTGIRHPIHIRATSASLYLSYRHLRLSWIGEGRRAEGLDIAFAVNEALMGEL